MTAANPQGQGLDYIRNCYSSWMRVPEYKNPIRVRWYKVADSAPDFPGSSDYVSSNYDDDRLFDPPLGEQSTTRNPFIDWRNCAPPPWPQCVNCPLGSWPRFWLDFTQVQDQVCNCGPLRTIVPLNYSSGCTWLSALIGFCNLPAVRFRLTIGIGGQVTLVLGRGATPLAEWAVQSGFDCYTLPLALGLVASTSTNCTWPATVQLIPRPV